MRLFRKSCLNIDCTEIDCFLNIVAKLAVEKFSHDSYAHLLLDLLVGFYAVEGGAEAADQACSIRHIFACHRNFAESKKSHL